MNEKEKCYEDSECSCGGSAGGIAEGFYGVPDELKEECYKRLPEPLLKVLKAFTEYLERNNQSKIHPCITVL